MTVLNRFRWSSFTALSTLTVTAALFAATACSSSTPSNTPGDKTLDPSSPECRVNCKPDTANPGDTEFESDDPNVANASRGGSDAANGGAADAGSAAPPKAGDESGEAARAIEEADIIQLRGSRLYALSRTGGLSVIDVGVRDQLRLLGRLRMEGVPFEMYVRDEVVYAMYSSFGHYEYDQATQSGKWVQSSEIVALDVHDPQAIRTIQEFAVPGEISDSRIVGDVLYAVSFENGYCWNCASTPNTSVVSISVQNPSAIRKIDQVTYSSTRNGYSWSKRSVTATNQRMYIAGPDWNWDGRSTSHSVIDVLDISDAGGRLVRGASVDVEGQINSRWQMDEYDGVLRVVSQSGNGWWTSGLIDPAVQTFRIVSSNVLTPLGRTTLRLPERESLRSVRFDGTRGYAITAQQTDPLFTIDLTDPALPKQVGELQMPGFVYHMEPRGNRVIGLGFDQRNPAGPLTVSLFDVSDMAHPTMIKRVNFGSGWASLGEDQDRIHKSFQVLDSQNLILVPFASYGRWTGDSTCSPPSSGIQLVDFANDDLTLRGLAAQKGQPRRAFLHDERLFAVSDNDVTTFDIGDRSAPLKKTSLELSNPAHRVVTMGGNVVQLTHDWWTGEASLAITPKNAIETGTSVGKVSLADLDDVDPSMAACRYGGYWSSWYSTRLLTNGNYVYVVVPRYGYKAYGSYESTTTIGVIDVSVPSAPRIVSRLSLSQPFPDGYDSLYYGYFNSSYYGYYGYGMLANQKPVAQIGSTLGLLSSRTNYSYDSQGRYVQGNVDRVLRVVDLSNPTAPAMREVALPASLGAAGIDALGNEFVASSYRASPNAGKVRFYLDRVDVSNPGTPVFAGSVNVPGSLLQADTPSNNVVTVDYRRVATVTTSWEECYRAYDSYSVYWDSQTNLCTSTQKRLRLLGISGNTAVLRQTYEFASQQVTNVTTADDHLYVTYGYNYYYGYGGNDAGDQVNGIRVLSGIRTGALREVGSLATGSYVMAAAGPRFVTQTSTGVGVYDVSAGGEARLVGSGTNRSYYAYDVALDSDMAVVANGDFGLSTIPTP
ncbi:MAG: beta-propeller domain-containing protein [Polyangiaceae bacterium]